MMRMGQDITQSTVDMYKDFIDWVWEGKDRDKYDWSFCTYMDNEPYVNIIGNHIRYDQFINKEKYDRKYVERQKRNQKKAEITPTN